MGTFTFQKADKAKKKLRLALIGVAGSGKTYSALSMAKGLSGKIALIDTARGSASLYADIVDFDTLDLTQHSPENYIAAIKAAEQAGYDVIVIDSLSHSWIGVDGALEKVDKIAARSQTSNNFTAWRNVTPIVTQLVDTIMGSKCHVIATLRAKSEYIIEDVNGRKIPKKVGLAPVIRDGIEFEFDVVGDIDQSHVYHITKTRYSPLTDVSVIRPGIEFGQEIMAWLNSTPTQQIPPAIAKAKMPAVTVIQVGEPTNVTTAPKSLQLPTTESVISDTVKNALWEDAKAAGHKQAEIKALLLKYGWTSMAQITNAKIYEIRQELGLNL